MRACAVVCLGMAALCAGSCADADVRTLPNSTPMSVLPWSSTGEDQVIDAFEALAGAHSPKAPTSAFSREVLGPDFLAGAEVFSGAGVVGASWECAPKDIEDMLAEELAAYGWERIGATGESVSYVKDTGEIRWLCALVSRHGDAATAVVFFQEG